MRSCALETVANVIRGVTFSKAEGAPVSSSGRLPVIRAGSIQQSLLLEEGQIWVPAEKIKARQLIKKNDIVMCMSSGSSDLVGKCAKSTKDWKGSFGAFCAGIRVDETKCNSSYLYHFLCSPLFRNWTKSSSGANIKNIRASELAAFKIPLPPLKEQKRIAAILDKADAIRRKRQQAIDLTDQLLRSVFLDMFGDPVANPKGWETTGFGELIDMLTDYHANGSYKILKQHVELKNTKDYALMVRTTDLESENFSDNVKWITESAYTFLKKTKVFGGEILINKIGSAGAVYLMPHLNVPVSLAMNQFMIRCNDKCNNVFAYHYLKTEHADRQIKERVQGAVTKTITKDAVRSIQFINPPIELQNKFVDVALKIENELVKKLSNSKLDELFLSISQQAFNGELSKQAKAA